MSESSYKEYSYSVPSTNLLNDESTPEASHKQDYLERLLELYGVYVDVTGVYEGCSVTRYDLKAKPGTRLCEIYEMKEDLECQLAAGPIRIEKATPDDPTIGIEVPKEELRRYLIREMIESEEYKSADTPSIAIGKDNSGKVVMADLSMMSPLLIGGTTGSGKSMFIHSLIISILYKSSPEDVQLILVDTKGTELGIYSGIPHLPVKPFKQAQEAIEMLKWAVQEMDRRYRIFEDKGLRDIEDYNQYVGANHKDFRKLPHIVIIIDEYADLIIEKNDDVEESICRLAQLSRLAGIHLIISTQRPSYDILTGLIKANMSNRIAFAASNVEDSESILSQEGAECLLGHGDMLFYPRYQTKPLRIQGAFVSDEEVSNVVEYLKGMAQRTSFNNPLSDNAELTKLENP